MLPQVGLFFCFVNPKWLTGTTLEVDCVHHDTGKLWEDSVPQENNGTDLKSEHGSHLHINAPRAIYTKCASSNA